LLREQHRLATEQFESQTATVMALRTSGLESGDAADLGTQAAEAEQMEIISAALQQQVWRLQEAIDRFDSGRLGTCDGCGGPIPAARLEIMPWATHCVPCKERADRR
jgi:DnaK suppressor protein